jgi:hypothetical protein
MARITLLQTLDARAVREIQVRRDAPVAAAPAVPEIVLLSSAPPLTVPEPLVVAVAPVAVPAVVQPAPLVHRVMAALARPGSPLVASHPRESLSCSRSSV